MATIQVLGTGCSKCGHLLKNAEEAVSQLNRNDSVEKVDDIVKILDFNLGTRSDPCRAPLLPHESSLRLASVQG